MAQARAYYEAGEGDNLDNFYRVLAEFNQGSHPFTVERARLLDEWARSENTQQSLPATMRGRSNKSRSRSIHCDDNLSRSVAHQDTGVTLTSPNRP